MTSNHAVLFVMMCAVAAPLLAEVPIGFRVPVVVLEVLLGILIGPYVLGLAQFDGFVAQMFVYGMAASLFMAGMELDFSAIRGRPLSLAVRGWLVSLLAALMATAVLRVIPGVRAPLMVSLTLVTTGLGVLVPVFRDGGRLDTQFGRMIVAAGTVGEIGPIVAMSLLLSQQYSTWQEIGFLLFFLAVVFAAAALGSTARPPRFLSLLARSMHASSQLPVRISLLVLGGLFVLAQEFGFESILGAFAAGMVVGLASRGEQGKPFRSKVDAVMFGWFYPFFFVGTGIKLDLHALTRDSTTMLLVPALSLLFLAVRGAPAFLYRKEIKRAEILPFALSSAVASLSLIVVITEIGTRAKTMNPDIAAALVGAALLSILVYPTVAGFLLSRLDETTQSKQLGESPSLRG